MLDNLRKVLTPVYAQPTHRLDSDLERGLRLMISTSESCMEACIDAHHLTKNLFSCEYKLFWGCYPMIQST